METSLGPQHIDTIETMQNLANVHGSMGRLENSLLLIFYFYPRFSKTILLQKYVISLAALEGCACQNMGANLTNQVKWTKYKAGIFRIWCTRFLYGWIVIFSIWISTFPVFCFFDKRGFRGIQNRPLISLSCLMWPFAIVQFLFLKVIGKCCLALGVTIFLFCSDFWLRTFIRGNFSI